MTRALIAFILLLLATVPLPAEEVKDDARDRIDVVRRATDDGLFDFAEQEAALLVTRADFPYTDEALVIVLRCRVETSQFDKALSLFPRIEREFPNSTSFVEASYWKARAQIDKAASGVPSSDRNTLLNEAVSTLRVVSRKAPDTVLMARANMYLGIALNELGQSAEAAESLNKAVHDVPAEERGILALHLSKAYQAMRKYDEALVSLGGAVEETAPPAIRRNGFYQRAEVNYMLGRWQDSLDDYGRVIALNKGKDADDLDYRSHYGLGWALSKMYDENPKKDPAVIKRSVDEMTLATKSPSAAIRSPARIKLGHLYISAGQDENAKTVLYPLLEESQSLQQAAFLLSQIEEKNGRIDMAVSLIEKALPSARGDAVPPLLVRLAELCEKAGRYNDAIDALSEIAKHVPNGPVAAQAAFDKARLLVLADRAVEAVLILDALEKDLETSQFVPPEEVLYWRGKITLSIAAKKKAEKDYSEAEQYLRTYMERYPNGRYRENAVTALMELYEFVPDEATRHRGINLLESLAEKGAFPPAMIMKMHVAIARILSSLGDPSLAAKAYRSAASLASAKEKQSLLLLAVSEYINGNLPDDASAVLPTVDIKLLQGADLAKYYELSAALEHAHGRYQASARAFEKLAMSSSNVSEQTKALIAAAGENLDAGNLQAAEKALAGINPDAVLNKLDYNLLAARLSYAKGDAASMKAAAEAALALARDDAKSAFAGLYLGRALRMIGKSKEATDAFETAATKAKGRVRFDALVEGAEASLTGSRVEASRSRKMYLTAYFETVDDKQFTELNKKALRGAVEASIMLAADQKDTAKRAEILDGAASLLSKCPDSDWKTQKSQRIQSLR